MAANECVGGNRELCSDLPAPFLKSSFCDSTLEGYLTRLLQQQAIVDLVCLVLRRGGCPVPLGNVRSGKLQQLLLHSVQQLGHGHDDASDDAYISLTSFAEPQTSWKATKTRGMIKNSFRSCRTHTETSTNGQSLNL